MTARPRPTNVAPRSRCRRSRLVVLLLGVLACAGALAGGIAGCGQKSDAKGSKGGAGDTEPVPVTLAAPVFDTADRTVDVVGTLFAQDETTVAAKVGGRIEWYRKDVGDAVEPGEALAQVEQVDYHLAVEQRERALAESLAKLSTETLPGPDFDPDGVVAVRRAMLQAASAEARYNRGKQLHDQDPPLLSDQDFADLNTAWQVAKYGYLSEVVLARSTVAEAHSRHAMLRMAQQALADTAIRAPRPTTRPAEAPVTRPPSARRTKRTATGTRPAALAPPATRPYHVTARLVSAGEYVKEGSPAYRVINDDPIKLIAAVPERFVTRIEIGQEADVSVEAYADPFPGHVARLNPQVDPANRTFQVEIRIPNPGRRLKAGSFARASILVDVERDVLYVPQDAIVSFAGENKLFRVAAGGKAAQYLVELGARHEDGSVEVVRQSLVVPGKKPVPSPITGDPVIVTNTNRLATGIPLKVEGPATRPATRRAAGAS